MSLTLAFRVAGHRATHVTCPPHSLTPPIPAVSTPLHCRAANEPLRWLVLSFRYIPRLELRRQAGGCLPDMNHARVAMIHASCAR